eukprot:134264-Chlamydomonas_euryale.AAC.1
MPAAAAAGGSAAARPHAARVARLGAWAGSAADSTAAAAAAAGSTTVAAPPRRIRASNMDTRSVAGSAWPLAAAAATRRLRRVAGKLVQVLHATRCVSVETRLGAARAMPAFADAAEAAATARCAGTERCPGANRSESISGPGI